MGKRSAVRILAAIPVRTDPVSDWIASLALLVVRRAAWRAPSRLSGRLEEEWAADLMQQRPGINRLKFAFGCYIASLAIDSPRPLKEAVPVFATARGAVQRTANRPSGFMQIPGASMAGTVICEINTTPLIDVMLVLLITLIVSLPLMTHAVKLDLPQAPPITSPVLPEVIDLEIDHDGTVVWNGTAVADSQQLESYFRAAARQNPQPEIHLRAERRAKYDFVAKVLASAQRNRMQKIGFVDTEQFK
jgi:biopolymer transport protein ExbD